jgi:hypothetical protein
MITDFRIVTLCILLEIYICFEVTQYFPSERR